MNLVAYLKSVRDGTLTTTTGGSVDGKFISVVATLDASADLDDLTAEAFHQGAFSPDTPWNQARATITEALKK